MAVTKDSKKFRNSFIESTATTKVSLDGENGSTDPCSFWVKSKHVAMLEHMLEVEAILAPLRNEIMELIAANKEMANFVDLKMDKRSLNRNGLIRPDDSFRGGGLKYGGKTESLNCNEASDEIFLAYENRHCEFRPIQYSESSVRNGMKLNQHNMAKIKEVYFEIFDILLQGLPSSEERADSEDQTISSKYLDQRSETENETCTGSKGTQQYARNKASKEATLKKTNSLEREAKQSLNEKEVNKLKKEVNSLKEELNETMLQFGSLSVEHTKMVNDNKVNEEALMKVQFIEKSAQTVLFESLYSETSSYESASTFGDEAVEKPDETSQDEPGAVGKNPVDEIPVSLIAKVSTEESSDREGISLGNVPTTAVERSLYNNYKFLLLIMAKSLLSSEVVKLKDWAGGTFSIDTSRDASDIFLELDRKRVISASSLALLREFLEKILRFDLVHLIDCFMLGDYPLLRKANYSVFSKNGTRIPNSSFVSRSPQVTTGTSDPRRGRIPTSGGVNPWFSSENSESFEIEESFVDPPKLEGATPNFRTPFPKDDRPVHKNNAKSARNSAVNEKEKGRTTESRVPVERPAISHGSKPSFNMGSNGQKLSKFPRQNSQGNNGGNSQNSDDDSDDDVNEQWLCNHYKRRCHVKFACCNKYWPCHRCHNNESNCGQKKLKSIHTKFVKCTKCSTEQEFSERSQFCINCHTKFAKYFCPTCKHLTGKDDKPYHCAKCGICRIHKHRSFHCDVCGVCLDVQLQDNHRCRAGSAHDECCICLEDAFTGCQILPCSHKVHKDCATKMIRSGITRCPICRESFAHKLEKRPPPPPGQHFGKT